MAKAAAILLVLLSYLWSTVQDDVHILRCSFTVKSGSIRIESIQCSVDGVSLHSNYNDNTRKEGNAPKECAYLFSKLKGIGGELWSQLHIMEEEGYLTRGNHSLLVTAVSLHKEGQPINGYWNFTLDGHHSFSFNSLDSKNKKYALTHNNIPGIDKWQSNTDLTQDLETFSIGDSDLCFQEILSQSKKMARPTSRTPDIGNVTSSPSQLPSTMNTTQLPSTMNTTQLPSTMNTTQLPSTMNTTQFMSTKQPPSKGGYTVTVVLISIAIFVIIPPVSFYIYKYMKRNSPQGGEMCSKLCIPDFYICGTHGGQHTPSAVGEPRPEESICMALMSPLEGDSPHGSPASSS